MITDSDDPDTTGSLLDTIEIDDGSNVAFIYNASQKAATPACQVVICSSYELRIHAIQLLLYPMTCGLFTKCTLGRDALFDRRVFKILHRSFESVSDDRFRDIQRSASRRVGIDKAR